jgi:hypothetical protein
MVEQCAVGNNCTNVQLSAYFRRSNLSAMTELRKGFHRA